MQGYIMLPATLNKHMCFRLYLFFKMSFIHSFIHCFFNYGRAPVNRDWHTSRGTRTIVSETMYSCVDPLTVLRPGHMWKTPISITSTLVQIKLRQLMKSMVYPTYHFSRTLLQRKLGTHAQSRIKCAHPHHN